MKGLQGYAYQKNNKLIDAVITAAVAASAKQAPVYPVTKNGNGNIRVSGNFSGAEDAKYEVKIVDDSFTSPSISAPIFRGAGTGKIRDIAATGLNAQKIQALCLSTGVPTSTAIIEIEGLQFRAKQSGAPGNLLYIVVDDSGLVFTDSTFSTIKPLKIGDTGLEGQEWDWDTKVLQSDKVPADAHRIAFGLDRLHIHVQYKKYMDDKYLYYFVPPLRADIPAGTKVYFVTGGRTVTVSNGTINEVYNNIKTIADFWTAVRADSQLIEPVDSSINTLRDVDSPAVREFATKTNAYYLPPYKGDKSSEFAGQLEGIVVNDANTKTELIEAKCIDNSFIGAEVWDVRGSSSGYLGQAKSGEEADFGVTKFTIPKMLPANWGIAKEDWNHEVKYAAGTRTLPPICFDMRLGINARPDTLYLEYKKKPPACICPGEVFSDKCLGFEQGGGEEGMAYTVPDLASWTDVLAERMKEKFRESQTDRFGSSSEVVEVSSFETPASKYFKLFKNLAQRIMALPENNTALLTQMVTDFKALTKSLKLHMNVVFYSWQPSLNRYVGEQIRAGGANFNYRFECTVAGISGSTQPTWPTGLNQTVVDGTATWKNTGLIPTYAWLTWDDTNGAWINDLNYQAYSVSIEDFSYDTIKLVDLWDDVLDYEKTYGVKKNSVTQPGGCYIESEDEYYWEVRGSKKYQPAYTDIPYYSTVKSGDFYINTKEFAFHISVPCGGTLLEGDQIIVTIGGIEFEHTYLIGDITYLPTIAASNLKFSGGVTGDDTYVFEVQGTVNDFPNYLLDRKNPQPYNQPDLYFMIDDGIILFQVGDIFEFNIEGGHWKWRKDGGDWSAALAIQNALQLMDAGLSIGFDSGVSPSFLTNDLWEIIAFQENKAANMVSPLKIQYKGTGNLPFGFAAPQTIDTLIIDMHNLTGSVTFKASNDPNFGTLIYSEVIPVTPLIYKLYIDTPITAQYFRIEPGSGTKEIGHVFLGSLIQLSSDAKVDPVREYAMSRLVSREPFSQFNYAQIGYEVGYDEFIYNSEYEPLIEMIHYLKTNNDLPLYFIPNVNITDECLRGWLNIDTFKVGSIKDVNVPKANRIYNLRFSVVGRNA